MNKVCVEGQRMYFYRHPEPIPKSQVNFSRIEFDMDETWGSFLSVVAQFIQNGEPKNVQVKGGYCFVPPELEVGAFELCLRGDDGESVVASVNRLTFEVCEGFDSSGETPLPPSPDLYTQLVKEIDSGKKIAQSVREDADAGRFNGERGADGGWYTPSVTQTDENTLRMDFTPSKGDMPDVAHTDIMLPNGGGGISDHSKLSNRDAADQHPMNAITGLVDALAGKQPKGDYIPNPPTASVGQTIKVSAVDKNGQPTEWEAVDMPEQVQADWNQNDSTAADYVKNRTHYTKMDTVLEYGVLSGFEDPGDGTYVYNLPYTLDIYDGLKVEVTWDNQVYHLTATQPFEGFTFIGNSIILGGDDTGEPFFIMINKQEGTTSVGSTSTETSHEVGIVVETPVRIKPHFLPSNIAYLKNGIIPLGLVIPTEESVFGGSIAVGGAESTLENPYPNKKTLNNLTLETFNAMLDGTIFVPKNVMIANNIASVDIHNLDRHIIVSWNEYSLYSTSDYGVSGATIQVYNAKIHEDADHPGTIVSEYAKIIVANKQLT